MPVACQRRAKTGTAEMTREISNANADPSLLGTQLGRTGAVMMAIATTKSRIPDSSLARLSLCGTRDMGEAQNALIICSSIDRSNLAGKPNF